jgi:tetracycline resistance efflux pump
VLLLCLSWGLGHQCEALETGTYVAGWAEQNLNILYLPLLVFSISGIIAFSTGTSWGAITIMVPIVFSVTAIHGAENFHLLLGSIACILGGASFGDHCSPVSDTTILSAMASGCDHMMHVRTQIPYALLAGAGSLFGYMVNSILGFGPYPGIVAGLVFTGAVFYSLSKKAAFHD